MQKSIISWTNLTWNPTHGCSVVSEGCRNCYAAQLSNRYGWTKLPWTGANAAANVSLKPHKLTEPLKIKEPSRIFVNSMSDLFHPIIPDDYIRQVFDVMNRCPQHVFQILTKRPERAAEWEYGWSDHIWMGTSVEDARVRHRIDSLRRCKAKVLFLSSEPLIGPYGDTDLTGIHWVIVGGESGKNHRPMQQAWAREIKNLCLAQNVAFFYKQDSGFRTELRPWLVEADGSRWQWHQFPFAFTPPLNLDTDIQQSRFEHRLSREIAMQMREHGLPFQHGEVVRHSA